MAKAVLRLVGAAMALGFSVAGRAAIPPEPSETPTCGKRLEMPKHVTLYSSGRDEQVLPELAEALVELSKPGGILERLGIANPPHTAEFMPSGELSVLASLGRHPIGHWIDGGTIANAGSSAGGVLEFVTPGHAHNALCPQCRSFYSDTTSIEHQLSVIFHVMGHNDFASHSPFAQIRPSDPIGESFELAKVMADLYEKYDHDEVARWYQWLQSLGELQDLARGTFEAPETFDPANQEAPSRVVHTQANVRPYGNRRHPRRPTPSVLQALASNMPPHLPEWKKDMVRRFERMERVTGFYASNKIMNEGWASLMQELLPRYTRWNTTHYEIEFADLMQGVARPELSNPYWLGREAWRILRRKFELRPEIQNLSQEKKDFEFIKWAHERVIGQMDDYEFLLFALDEQFITTHKLHLRRKAGFDEAGDIPPPPPGKFKAPEQKVSVSNDWKRVVHWIARKLADRRLQMPRILLTDLLGQGRGAIAMKHEAVESIPLDRKSTVQALYVMALMVERPVHLDTLAASSWTQPKVKNPWADYPWMRHMMPPPPKLTMTPIRYEVEPDGTLRVWNLDADGNAVSRHTALELQLKPHMDAYRDETDAVGNDSLASSDAEKFRPFITEANNALLAPGMDWISHSPTAGDAMLEFSSFFKRRLLRALEMATAGKMKMRRTARGVKLAVFPPIPKFRLDRKVKEALFEALPPSPVDVGTLPFGPQLSTAMRVSNDDDLDLGEGDRRAGDKYWGEGKKKSKGQPEDGDEDEDGDPSDEDGEDPNIGPGDDDPSEVEIPHDLFHQFYFRNFELPNLKKDAQGDSVEVESVREGSVNRPHGEILVDRTSRNALALAVEARRRKRKPFRGIPAHVLMREGFKLLQPAHNVVISRDTVPLPSKTAVVVFVIDLTGSMTGRPQQVEKKWVAEVDRLIRERYTDVTVRFVGYANDATEYPREEIFKAFKNGGNTDSTGYQLADEIISAAEYAAHDKYVFGLGDGGSNDMQTHEVMKALYKKTSYMGFVQYIHGRGGFSWAVPSFLDPIEEMSQSLPWFGFAHLEDSYDSLLRSIDVFFKQEKK